ncbi:MAG: ATP-binding cassette domain-containing protein [Firmicutes bacterium]|nr:ATP-binding cassette domain-containing protein [Bacillota bacterium]
MTLLSVVTWFFTSLGMWRILKKYDKATWQAFIPGLRYYRMGQVCGREQAGFSCLIVEVISRILSTASNYVEKESTPFYAMSLAALVLVIMLVVFEVRVVAGLCQSFELRRRWIVLWIISSSITSMILGFFSKYQPVHVFTEADEEDLAGTQPVDLSAPVAEEDSGDGLSVHVRARTVRTYGKTRYLLKDVHLTIPNGSLVLLLGGSGAGKTTLVNAIIGYEKADATIRLNGTDVYQNYSEVKHRIGFAPQQDLLRMYDNVSKTLGDAALMRLPVSVSAKEREEKIGAVMDVLGLSGRADGLVAKKSGGLRKRISIGTELISDPELFILDEPDSGLDGVIARELFEKLRSVADTGKVVITITHTPDRVADLFDKVIVLARDSGKVGRLAFYGSPDEAKEFFGKPSMEQVVLAVNGKHEGGEGRADEFIEKYARLTAEKEETVRE